MKTMMKKVVLLAIAVLCSGAVRAEGLGTPVLTEINDDKAALDTLHGELGVLSDAALTTKGEAVIAAADALLAKIDNAVANFDGAGTPAITSGADPLADAAEKTAAMDLIAPTKLIKDDGVVADFSGQRQSMYLGAIPVIGGIADSTARLSAYDSLLSHGETLLSEMDTIIAAGAGNPGGMSVAGKHNELTSLGAEVLAEHETILLSKYGYINSLHFNGVDAASTLTEIDVVENDATATLAEMDPIRGTLGTPTRNASFQNYFLMVGREKHRAGVKHAEIMLAESTFAVPEPKDGFVKKNIAGAVIAKADEVDGSIDSFVASYDYYFGDEVDHKQRILKAKGLAAIQANVADAQIKAEEGGVIMLPHDPVQFPTKVDEKKAKFAEAKGLLEISGGPIDELDGLDETFFEAHMRPTIVSMKQDVFDLQTVVNKSIEMSDSFKELNKRFNDVPQLKPSNAHKVRKSFDRVRQTGEILMPIVDEIDTKLDRLGVAGDKIRNYVHDVRFEMDAMKHEADAVFANLEAHVHTDDVASIAAGWHAGDAAGTVVETTTAGPTGPVTDLTTAEKNVVAKYVNSMENRTRGEFHRGGNALAGDETLAELVDHFAGVSPVDGSKPGVRPHVHRQVEAVAFQLARGFDPENIMSGLTDIKALFDKFTDLEGYAKAAHVWVERTSKSLDVDNAGDVSAANTAWTTFLGNWKTLLAETETIPAEEGGGTEPTFSTDALTDFDKVVSDHADMTDIFAASGVAATTAMDTALPILNDYIDKSIAEFKRRLTSELEGLFLDIRNEEQNFDHDKFDGEMPSSAEIVNEFTLAGIDVAAIDDASFAAADKDFFSAIGDLVDKYVRFEPKHTHDWKQQVNVEIPLTTDKRKAQIVVTGEGNDVTEFRQIAVSGVDKDQAQVNVMMEKSGRIGLGGAGVNDNSLKALSVLGEDAVTIVPNGNGVVTLNADVIISSDQPFIPTPDFGKEEDETVKVKVGETYEYVTRKKKVPHRITFTSAVPHAIRVVRGATLDLTAFGTTGDQYVTNGKQICFDGEVSLVLEPGAKIRFPFIESDREDQAPVLYFNGNSKLIFEGSGNRDDFRWRKAHGEPVNVEGYNQDIEDIGGGTMRNYGTASDLRCQLLGVGKLWFNKNARMEVMGQAMVGVEADYRSPKTVITVSLQRKAQFCIGSLDRAGGAFQIGNVVEGGPRVDPVAGWDPTTTPIHPNYPNNEDHPKYDPNDPTAFEPRATQVDFNLVIDGPEARFHIDREGFFGCAVGVVNKKGSPNGDIPDASTDPLSDCDQFNAWRVNALQDVRNIVIDLKQGYFDHNKIADGSDGEASLMAMGPVANRYEFHLGQSHEAIWRGGGNVLFVRSEVGGDGTHTDATMHPLPVSVWSEAQPLTGTTADSGRYSILAPPRVMRGRLKLGRATITSDASGWVFKGPEEEAYLVSTMADYKLFGEKIVAAGNNQFDTKVGYVIDEGGKKVIHRDTVNKVLDTNNNPTGVRTAAEHGQMLGGRETADGTPAQFIAENN